MSGIKKFSVLWEKEVPEGEWGDYVKTVDHEAEVSSWKQAAALSMKHADERLEEIARLRDEVERYRKDAERYRWLRNEAHMVDGMYPAVIVAEEDFPVDGPRTDGFVFHDELDTAIDAAMGASA